jgi:RND family efflux transporter MFP subunit
MKNALKIGFYFGIFTLVLAACSAKKETPIESTEKKGVPVKIEKMEATTKPLPIVSSGKLNAKEEIRLSFKIGGIVNAVYAQEGQYVKKGTLLAKLDQQEIASQVTQANAGLEKAKRDLQRAETLYQDTVVTLEQVQNARTAVEVAQANVKISAFNQQYAAIYAPVSGRIIKKLAEKNEVLGPGSPVYLLAATDKAPVIRVGLSDKDVVKIELGDTADVQFDAYDNVSFKATVTEIAASASQGIGTFEVELMVEKGKYNLKQGFVGKVAIYPSGQEPYYQVPVSAVFEADKKTVYVFVPDEKQEKATKIALQTNGIGENFLIVKKDSDLHLPYIITEGNAYLKNGSEIIPQPISSTKTVVGN